MLILFSDTLVEREITRLYDRGFDWITSTGPKLVLALIMLICGLWLIRIARRRMRNTFHKKNVHSTLRPFFSGVATVSLYVALAFLIMEILGIRLTMFAAVIAAFGAAAGLALSGTLQNFASGVLILLLKPFKVEDNIITQGFEGTVTSIQIFYTIITTYDNKTVVMPNSKLSNEVIINVTQQGYRRLDFLLCVNHNVKFEEIRELLLNTYKDLPEVCNDPAPRVGVGEIKKDDYGLANSVWVNAHGFEDSRQKINNKIIEVMHTKGIYKAEEK